MLLGGSAFWPADTHARKKTDEASQAKESTNPVVLELFTASDCSACIFADRMLYDAMKHKNVVALSCHIKDFSDSGEDSGKPKVESAEDPCSFRHWAFKSGRKSRDIKLVLPTFYFNAESETTGSNFVYFNTLLKGYTTGSRSTVIRAAMTWKDGDTVSISLPEVQPEGDKPINASVWIVRYKEMSVEKMDTGVNKGRVLRFSNIVQSITHVAKWHGEKRTIETDVAVPLGGKERGGYIVLVAPYLGAQYLAAGQLKDYPVAADIKEEEIRKARAKANAQGRLEPVPVQPQPANKK